MIIYENKPKTTDELVTTYFHELSQILSQVLILIDRM